MSTHRKEKFLNFQLGNLKAVFLKLCFMDHRRSMVVLQVVHGSFERKRIVNILPDTQQMKNTPIHVCAKTACVG
jgi:hypothetical protein